MIDLHADERLYTLAFGVQRSIRYHDARRRHFDWWHTATQVLSFLFASAAVATIANEMPTVGALSAAVVALLLAIDVVVGSSRRARQHAELKARFCDLEIDLLSGENADDVTVRRLRIERDAPATLDVLNVLMHNAEMRAQGHEDDGALGHVTAMQRWCAPYFDFRPDLLAPKRVLTTETEAA